METTMLSISLLLIYIAVAAATEVHNSAHAQQFVVDEPYTNMTIDQLIMQSYGGPEGLPDMFLGNDTLLAEMDMVLTTQQFNALYGASQSQDDIGPDPEKQKAIRPIRLRWPNGVIPYEIRSGDFDAKDRAVLNTAINEWNHYTCLKLRPATPGADTNRIRIQNGYGGCNSQLGMVGGTQDVNLYAPGCRFKGLYLHEIGHAIGLVHEHQLPDRDRYIYILYNNVQPNLRIWFKAYTHQEVDTINVLYEYSSVMHYGITAFSFDGRSQTIRTRDPSKEHLIGQVWKKGLGFSDIKIVNFMYNCAAHCPKTVECTGGGFVDKHCKCYCPDGTSSCQVGGGGGGGGDGENCTNIHDDAECEGWARNGECEKNPAWMIPNCRKACGRCEGGGGGDGDCKDNNVLCGEWARRGECSKNPGYMLRNCRKSCNVCFSGSAIDGAGDCADSHPQCKAWAKAGYCQRSKGFMNKTCKNACDTCHAPPDGKNGA